MRVTRLNAFLWRCRYLLVCATVAAVVFSLFGHLKGLRPATHEIVVAARDLPAGSVLAKDDFERVRVPSDFLSRASVEDLSGFTLAASVPEGYPLSSDLVLNSEFLEFAPPGHSIVSVTITNDGTLELAQVGSHVAVYPGARVEDELAQVEPLVPEAVLVGVAGTESSGGFLSSQADTQQVYLAVPTQFVNVLVGHSVGRAVKLVIYASATPAEPKR